MRNFETEDIGHSVLAYQFTIGLRQEIKVKVAGMEGSFELLTKATIAVKVQDVYLETAPLRG